jgi:hypothetical protein
VYVCVRVMFEVCGMHHKCASVCTHLSVCSSYLLAWLRCAECLQLGYVLNKDSRCVSVRACDRGARHGRSSEWSYLNYGGSARQEFSLLLEWPHNIFTSKTGLCCVFVCACECMCVHHDCVDYGCV